MHFRIAIFKRRLKKKQKTQNVKWDLRQFSEKKTEFSYGRLVKVHLYYINEIYHQKRLAIIKHSLSAVNATKHDLHV